MRSRTRGVKIGEILVQHGVLTPAEVREVLSVQRRTGRPFGELAETLFGVPPDAVEEAWITQYVRTVGLTDLDRLKVDPACLSVVNRRQAWQFHVLPVSRQRGELTLATDEASLTRTLLFATRAIREPVFLRVAAPRQLRDYLMRYYPVPRELAELSDRLARLN
ncbi:MAG: hypothetical protein ACK4PI_02955 [Tepidisphaerales bacterium]